MVDIVTVPMDTLSDFEWEQLCDHCGRCCLIKLEDDRTADVFYTNIICKQYDIEKGQCGSYQERQQLVPGCIVIRSFGKEIYSQLPETCAYRLRYNNKPLPEWHPLLVGNTKKMQQAMIYVSQRVVSEQSIHDEQFEDHIVDDIM
ncbi:UPF0260 protein YcgN [hydrothermal vent metagenome]|uniref:UPF0260 protein YcgN n=1 Tax=hydrothermal vent metagenome TaxID=652676 RepID=A0A3B0ZW12_9ZZZZ